MKKKNKTSLRSYIIAVIVVALMFSAREILPTKVFITSGVIGMLLGPVAVFLLDHCFKKKGETSKLIYIFNEVFVWLGLSSFFVLGIYGFMYSFENDSFLPFWAVSLLVGIAGGIFITVIMVKKMKKFGTVLIGLLIAVFITFLASIYISHLNYVLDTTEPTTVEAVILDKDVTRRRKSPDEYSFEIEIDGREFDVKVTYAEYEKYEVGDIYSFKKYNGAFGEPFYISE